MQNKWRVDVGDRTMFISEDLAKILGFQEPVDETDKAVDTKYMTGTMRLCFGLAEGLTGDEAAIFSIAKMQERDAAQTRAYLSGGTSVPSSPRKNVLETLLGR
jgi:hypothetical protein